MSLISRAKAPIKQIRWRMRRSAARRRFGARALADAPIVIGNAMPKSGSHLLSQVLTGLTQIGPFVDPGMRPLTRSEDNRNLLESQVIERIHQLRSGDLAYAYLHARQPYLRELLRKGVASIFIYRDPRDVLVSHVFYATELYPGHGMHQYYLKLNSMEERLSAAIEGVSEKGFELSSIRRKYDQYLEWLNQEDVLSLRFEDLIQDREATLSRILTHLGNKGFVLTLTQDEAISRLAHAITPRKSGTFRKGLAGEWREHFTKRNISLFKEITGDLLVQLGYERKEDW